MQKNSLVALYGVLCPIIIFSVVCYMTPAYGQDTRPLNKTGDDWHTVSLREAGVKVAKIAELLKVVERGDFKDIHSILLVRNGQLCLEEYFQGYDRNKPHQIRSATKSIGSVLLGIAMDKGSLVSVEEPIYHYFKAQTLNRDNRIRAVTIKSLLTMTSGFECDDHRGELFQCERAMYKADDWVTFALNLPMAHQPGEVWAYNSTSLILLNEIIRQNTGQSVSNFADKYMMKPLGVTDFHWGLSPKGRVWMAGNASMRPRDMAKFGQLCLDNGVWKNQQIVSEKWLAESTRFHVLSEYGMEYGYLWWRGHQTISGRQVEAFWAQGNGGQVIFICPSENMVAVFTGGNYNSILEFQFMGMLINYIFPAMIPPGPEQAFISPDKRVLAALPGTYQCHQLHLDLFERGGGLICRLAGQETPVHFEGDDRFFMPNPIFGDMDGVILRDDHGRPSGLLIKAVFSSLRFKKL